MHKIFTRRLLAAAAGNLPVMAPGTSFHGLCHGYTQLTSTEEVLSTRATSGGAQLPQKSSQSETALSDAEAAAAEAAARRRFIDFRLDLPETYLRQLVLWRVTNSSLSCV